VVIRDNTWTSHGPAGAAAFSGLPTPNASGEVFPELASTKTQQDLPQAQKKSTNVFAYV
jgi:hypothetical protein